MEALNTLFTMWSVSGIPLELQASCRSLVREVHATYASAQEALGMSDLTDHYAITGHLSYLANEVLDMDDRIVAARK